MRITVRIRQGKVLNAPAMGAHEVRGLGYVGWPMPGSKTRDKVVADDEAGLALDRVSPGDLLDGVDRIGQAASAQFAVVYRETGVARRRQAQHCEAVNGPRLVHKVLVRRPKRRHEENEIVAELGAQLLGHDEVPDVNGIKAAAEEE
jgi:hypothetical protein